jgi:hypothetical protein
VATEETLISIQYGNIVYIVDIPKKIESWIDGTNPKDFLYTDIPDGIRVYWNAKGKLKIQYPLSFLYQTDYYYIHGSDLTIPLSVVNQLPDQSFEAFLTHPSFTSTKQIALYLIIEIYWRYYRHSVAA